MRKVKNYSCIHNDRIFTSLFNILNVNPLQSYWRNTSGPDCCTNCCTNYCTYCYKIYPHNPTNLILLSTIVLHHSISITHRITAPPHRINYTSQHHRHCSIIDIAATATLQSHQINQSHCSPCSHHSITIFKLEQ